MNRPNVIIIPDLKPTDTDRKVKAAGIVISLGLVVFGLYSCSANRSVNPPTAKPWAATERLRPITRAELEAKVAPDAVMLMKRSDYPKMYAKLGARRFAAANGLTRWAALAAAEHGGMCDRVSMVNLSDRTSRASIVWFADCANGQRVMIDQEQAEDVRKRFAGKGK